MNKDTHKGILGITYNSLNLPMAIEIANPAVSGRTKYVYSASGVKLQVTHETDITPQLATVMGTAPFSSGSSQTKVTDYVGNKIYEGGLLRRILVDGGYIENNIYHFYLTDHLGNNRVVAKADGTIVQKTHYYPFGMAYTESTGQEKQPYKYNGKELDKTHGLNLYDYSARYYGPGIGRFTSIDPMAEEYYNISPYVYCDNNPMKYIDPTGMVLTDYRNEKGELLYHTEDGLKDVIIVADKQVPKLEEALQNAKDNETINDAETNKKEMHKLGRTPQKYTDEALRGGGDYWVLGYKETYPEAYKEGKSNFSFGQILSGIVSALASGHNDSSGSMRHRGRTTGINEGNYDRENGKINRLNPSSSFKDNSPLIILKDK